MFKEKTPTQRAQFSAKNRLGFACLQPDHIFGKCPKARKCTKPGCESTHKVLLHGAEKVFSPKYGNKLLNNSNSTSHSNSNSTAPPNRNKPQTSSSNVAGSPSYMKLTGLLPVLQLEINSHTNVTPHQMWVFFTIQGIYFLRKILRHVLTMLFAEQPSTTKIVTPMPLTPC